MRKAILILVLLSLVLFATGCWNSVDLNQARFVLGMGLDIDENGKYEMTTSVYVPKGSQEKLEAGSLVSVQSAKGNSIFECIRNLIMQTGYKSNFSHLRYITISHQLAEKGLVEPLDMIMRDQELRLRTFVQINDGKAKDILMTAPTTHQLLAIEIQKGYEMGKSVSKFPSVELFDLMKMLASVEGTGYLPRVKKIQVGKKEALLGQGMSIMKQGKIVADFNEEETRAVLFVNGKVKSAILNVPVGKQQQVAIEVIRMKSSRKIKRQGNSPVLAVEIEIEGNIGEMAHTAISHPIEYHKIEQLTSATVRKEVLAAIHRAQEEKVDLFHFSDVAHRNDPQAWRQWRGHWGDVFSKAQVEVTVSSKIVLKGFMRKSLKSGLED